MKIKYLLSAFFIIFLFLFSCDRGGPKQESVMDAATGSPGEILVIMNNVSWESDVGESLRSVFLKDLYNVPEREVIFDLFQIKKSEFQKINKRHRNVIIPQIGKGAEYGEIRVKKNVYSKPQTVVYIKAPDIPEFTETVKENSDTLINIFKKADRDRVLDYIYDYHVEAYRERLEEDHNVSLAVPKNYEIDKNSSDFVWLAYETQKSSHGFLIFHFGKNQKDTALLDYFIDKINEELKKNVPGDRKNSYMQIETKYHYPRMSKKFINNEKTWILDGLWRVENDFMGGPFSAFIKYDEDRQEYACVKAFIYDPRGDHRDKIRKMRSIMHTFKIPD